MNNKIEPVYVSFEQAKLLKEKGFKSKSRYYDGSGKLIETPDIPENDYTHSNNYMQRFRWESPEQCQVVEWLETNFNIFICVSFEFYKDGVNFLWQVLEYDISNERCIGNKSSMTYGDNGEYKTRESAYSDAFDYILKELI